jgi:hypothetical protein
MKGTPDNTLILHWDECRMTWAELSWQDWVRFRGVGEGRQSLLAGAKAGEHYYWNLSFERPGQLGRPRHTRIGSSVPAQIDGFARRCWRVKVAKHCRWPVLLLLFLDARKVFSRPGAPETVGQA